MYRSIIPRPACLYGSAKVTSMPRSVCSYGSSLRSSLKVMPILEGAEVRIGFYGQGGRILRGDTSEGAEGPEGWPRG